MLSSLTTGDGLSEGSTAVFLRKAVAVADPRTSSIRKEIQDYLRCCEGLLSTGLSSKSPRLSDDEEGIVEYYAVELSKLNPRQRSKLEYRHRVLEYIRLSEVLLKVDNLSDEEHEQMQQMVKHLTIKVLNSRPAAKR